MAELPPKCVPCHQGGKALNLLEEMERQELVPGWKLEDHKLRRAFALEDFRAALAWVNRVGMLAEEEGHHPDIHLTGWNQVELVLWTHAVGGLHDNDFVLAKKIDELWARSRG